LIDRSIDIDRYIEGSQKYGTKSALNVNSITTFLVPPRTICYRRCLSTCFKQLWAKLLNRFAWNFRGRLTMGQWTKG